MMTAPAWHGSALSYSGSGMTSLAMDETGRKTSFSPYSRNFICFFRICRSISAS